MNEFGNGTPPAQPNEEEKMQSSVVLLAVIVILALLAISFISRHSNNVTKDNDIVNYAIILAVMAMIAASVFFVGRNVLGSAQNQLEEAGAPPQSLRIDFDRR